jgi:hypothetical protein
MLAVFIVGALALVVDRVLLRPGGGPAAASADASDATRETVGDPGEAPPPPQSDVAAMLDEFASDNSLQVDSVRDLFALPGTWREAPKATPAAPPDPAALFCRAHRLNAVVLDEQTSYILLDDRLMVPGQSLDGFTLVAVRARSAVFEREGRPVTLELQEQGP